MEIEDRRNSNAHSPLSDLNLTIKFIGFFCILSLISVFIGCYSLTKPSLLLQEIQETTIRDDWKKYGAYYEADELFLEGAYQSAYIPFAGYTSTYMSQAIVSKRIRILTKEGTQYASVPVPHYLRTIKTFDLRLYDKNGKEKSLDVLSLKTDYENNGLIVFPNVSPGCALDIYIVFTSSRPLVTFEYRFARSIPVRHARFTFSRIPEFKYAFKEYGKLDVGRSMTSPENDDFTYTVWSRKNVLPRSNVNYLDNYAHPAPCASIAMRYGFNKSVFADWDDISTKLSHDLIIEPYTILEKDISKVCDTLIQRSEPVYRQADRALEWIQDNISIRDDDDNEFNPDDVLREGKGSIWEIAVATKEMFDYIGAPSDIVMTRPRAMGGFDENFITPLAMSMPIVVATIAKKDYCAFPYARGGTLGEYPQEFYFLKGVSLKKHSVVELPPPTSEKSATDYNYTIDLRHTDSIPHFVDISFKGYFAYKLRQELTKLSDKEVKEFFQKILTNLDKSNKLKTCQVFNLHERGKQLMATIQFSNNDQTISRKGKKRLSLSHVFDDYFNTLDTNRTSPYTIINEFSNRESITIKKPRGKKVNVTLYYEVIENDLFSVTGVSIDDPEYYTFNRELSVKVCDILPINFQQYYEKISKLNQIKDSYLIIQ